MDGREHAQRHADHHADEVPSVASSSVAGKTRVMSSITGLEVSTERPKSPAQHLGQVDPELLPERQVEAELDRTRS
jgi:hypothetical protein